RSLPCSWDQASAEWIRKKKRSKNNHLLSLIIATPYASSFARLCEVTDNLRQRCCYVDVKSLTQNALMFFLPPIKLNHPRPKRDLLLCVARHMAVTLTRNAPLSKAPSPGISVSRVEPSGVVSRFCLSSSRSLGRCLLLGQRSRMNFFSHHIRSLFHQDHGNPDTEFSRHRHNGHPGSLTAWMSVANQTEKLPQLSVLTDRRPGSLD